MLGFHIEYVPEIYVRHNENKGNGGKTGCSAGTRAVFNPTSVLHRDGCLKHNIARCEDCPFKDCDYDYSTELILQRERNEKNCA